MKHSIIPAALALAIAATGALADDKKAQDKKPAQPRAVYGASVQFFQKLLDLSEAQQKQWQAIRTAQAKATRELYADKKLTAKEKQAKYVELRKKFENQMLDTLTDAQKKKIATAQVERRKPWTERVGLNDKQKAKVDALNKKRQEASQKSYKEFAAKLEAIYTPEQIAKRKELTAAAKGGQRAWRGNYFEQLGFTDAR